MEIQNRAEVMKPILGREIAALLNPRAAVLVTCGDVQRVSNVLTVAWHTPLSHQPPLLGIAIDTRRHSYAIIEHNREFAINIVSMDFMTAVEFCGSHSGQSVDKFQAVDLKILPARMIRPPLIAGALAHMECKVIDRLQTGDHTFFVAEVVHAEARADCFSDSWQPEMGDVLLCLQRDRFCSWC